MHLPREKYLNVQKLPKRTNIQENSWQKKLNTVISIMWSAGQLW